MLERYNDQLCCTRRRGKFLDWKQLRIGTLQSCHQIQTPIPTSLFSEITLIACDQQGKVWIGADSMLFAWLIKEKKFVLFGESDGVIQNEYLSKPRLLSSHGDVYMGGVKDCCISTAICRRLLPSCPNCNYRMSSSTENPSTMNCAVTRPEFPFPGTVI